MAFNSRKNFAQKGHPYDLPSDAKQKFPPISSSSKYKPVYEEVENRLKRKRQNHVGNIKEKQESSPSKQFKCENWDISKPDVLQSEVRAIPLENGNQGHLKNMDGNKMRKNLPKIEKFEKPHTKELIKNVLKTSTRNFSGIVN